MYKPAYDLEGKQMEAFNVRVPEQMKLDIEAIARDENISSAKWIRRALLFALQHMDNDEVIVAPRGELRELMREVLREEGLLKKE